MRTAVLLLLLSALVGCSAFGHDCTAVGSWNGVTVEFAPGLQLVSGSLAVTVCDDHECGAFEDDWARRPMWGGLPALTATFDDLGRSFEPGTVHVTAELRDQAGAVIARREQAVELSRIQPNGKDCDGDGWVNGGMSMTLEDAVVVAS
ncbi:MAG TPA: hypothetical protein VFV89_19120 [Nocardioides sp.]|uniref:hypothetical protein n=1 Tax=Nocardioides sp. TaxID=35761 RepID=UPI002E315752|nr:hypothetical protein [Nocardioides sp.]HEX5089928.1 hypothetical protein [Nocardioides sp.]